jgi:regulator of sigma E protease
MTIIIFLAVLSVLVLVHELGHFVAARLTGVEVEEFGLGFPPRVFGWFKNGRGHWRLFKKGFKRNQHTIFSLNLIPLGGFVRLRGENGVSQPSDKANFANKTIGQRTIIIIAGVLMNIVLTAVIFISGLTIGWPQATDNLGASARVSNQELVVIDVLPDSPAERAGLRSGDAIVKIDTQPASSAAELRRINNQASGQPIAYEIRRLEEDLQLVIAAELLDNNSEQYSLGVALAESGIVSYPWPQAIWQGISLTATSLRDIAVGFWQLLVGLFSGQSMANQVAGPVGIAVLTGQISRLGWLYLLQFIAVLSLNLAFINILPLPALDGGRLFFILLEKITGHPAKAKLEAIIHSIGFILLLALVALVTIKDVIKLF